MDLEDHNVSMHMPFAIGRCRLVQASVEIILLRFPKSF
jgi:hypothetical protein